MEKFFHWELDVNQGCSLGEMTKSPKLGPVLVPNLKCPVGFLPKRDDQISEILFFLRHCNYEMSTPGGSDFPFALF